MRPKSEGNYRSKKCKTGCNNSAVIPCLWWGSLEATCAPAPPTLGAARVFFAPLPPCCEESVLCDTLYRTGLICDMEAKVSEQDRNDLAMDLAFLGDAFCETSPGEQATIRLSTGYVILTRDAIVERFAHLHALLWGKR